MDRRCGRGRQGLGIGVGGHLGDQLTILKTALGGFDFILSGFDAGLRRQRGSIRIGSRVAGGARAALADALVGSLGGLGLIVRSPGKGLLLWLHFHHLFGSGRNRIDVNGGDGRLTRLGPGLRLGEPLHVPEVQAQGRQQAKVDQQ